MFMAEEFSDSSSQKISKFNGTIAQLMRIDELWKKCHNLSTNGNLIGLNWVLDRVWVELSEDTEQDDEDEQRYWGFAEQIVKCKSSRGELNAVLIKKEMFLRKLQNKQGKGTAYEDPESDW